MDLGKPVVAPRMPAIETVIVHGEDGLLFVPQNVISFKEMLSVMLNDPVEAAVMGQKAHKKISANYTWEKHAAKILFLLDKTINKRNNCE